MKSLFFLQLLLLFLAVLIHSASAGNAQSRGMHRKRPEEEVKASHRLKSHPLFGGNYVVPSFSADVQMSSLSTMSESSSSMYAGSSLGWIREDARDRDLCFTTSSLVIRDWMSTFSRSFTVFNGNIVHMFREFYENMPRSLVTIASSSASACSTPTRYSHSRQGSFGSPCYNSPVGSDYSTSFEDALSVMSLISGGKHRLSRRQFTVDNNYRVVDALPYPSAVGYSEGSDEESSLVTVRTLDTRETLTFHLFKSPLIQQNEDHEQITMIAFLYWFLQKRYDEIRLRYGDSRYGFPTVTDLVRIPVSDSDMFDEYGFIRDVQQHDYTEMIGFVTDRVEYVPVWEKATQKYSFNAEHLYDKLNPNYDAPSVDEQLEFEEWPLENNTDEEEEHWRTKVNVKILDLSYVQSSLKSLLLSIKHMHRSCVYHGQLTSKFVLCSMSHCRILLSPLTSRFVVDDPADSSASRHELELTDYQANDLMMFFQDAKQHLEKFKCPKSQRLQCKEMFALLESKPISATQALKHPFFLINLSRTSLSE